MLISGSILVGLGQQGDPGQKENSVCLCGCVCVFAISPRVRIRRPVMSGLGYLECLMNQVEYMSRDLMLRNSHPTPIHLHAQACMRSIISIIRLIHVIDFLDEPNRRSS